MRLERLGQRMADAGYLESEDIMLDERHLALSRCLGPVNRQVGLYLGRWRTRAAAISAHRRQQGACQLQSVLRGIVGRRTERHQVEFLNTCKQLVQSRRKAERLLSRIVARSDERNRKAGFVLLQKNQQLQAHR